MFEKMFETHSASEKHPNPEGLFTFPTKPMTIDEVLEAIKKQGLDTMDLRALEAFVGGLQMEESHGMNGIVEPRETDIEGKAARVLEGEFRQVDSNK